MNIKSMFVKSKKVDLLFAVTQEGENVLLYTAHTKIKGDITEKIINSIKKEVAKRLKVAEEKLTYIAYKD